MIGSAFEAIQNLHYVRNLGATSCPFPTFGGSLLSFLQPLSGPSPFFVALRGNPFSPSRPLANPSRASSNPFVAHRGYLFAFSWKSYSPLATFGGSLSSLLQPLSGPSPFFVAHRGNLFPFSWKSFLPFPTFGGSLSSPLQPLRGPSPFFVAHRGYLFAFSWKSFLPFPTFGGSLSSLLQPLSGPSPSLVALRGNLFAFSWKSFLPFPTFGGSLSSLLQPLRGPSPFFVAHRGNLFPFFLRGPSWIPFVDFFFSSCLFVVLRAPSWIPSSIIVITFHHFKPPRGLSPICARIPLKRRLIPQVRAFAPAPPPFPFGRRAPAG